MRISISQKVTRFVPLSVFVGLIAAPSPANAAPGITLPSTFDATTSFTTVSGISVSDYTDVQATISVATGNIKITTTTGLSAPTGYNSSDWTSNSVREIAFTGTRANVNSALATLQYKAAALGDRDTITVTTFVSGAAYNSANGHFYEIIDNGSTINWETARCKAKYGASATFGGSPNSADGTSSASNSIASNDRCSGTASRRTLGGLNGYLANITSQAEHDFLRGKLTGTGWIGGADTDQEGYWRWMDGPESGQIFWFETGTATRRTTNTVNGLSQL
jgi:hypothetical protein